MRLFVLLSDEESDELDLPDVKDEDKENRGHKRNSEVTHQMRVPLSEKPAADEVKSVKKRLSELAVPESSPLVKKARPNPATTEPGNNNGKIVFIKLDLIRHKVPFSSRRVHQPLPGL